MAIQKSIFGLTSASSSRTTLGRYSDDFSMRSRSTSISSYTTVSSYGYLDDIPKLVKTPWEAERSRKAYIPRNRQPETAKSLSSRFFENLPDEIYQCILLQLEECYFMDDFGTCPTCYMKDLHSLTLTSRDWERSARQQLYSKIWMSAEEPSSVKKAASLPEHRIKTLRKTLRERPLLARTVKELHFPDAHELYQLAHSKDRQSIINSLASLIMACPKLEKFSGLYLTYSHSFDRLTYALTTRKCLKEKVWVMKANGGNWSTPKTQEPSWNIRNEDAFLHCHDNWSGLETLCMFGQGTGNMDYRAFVATFRNLPSLTHLLISDFNTEQFNDRTLQAIPPVQSLRLQDLPAITERGLIRYANSLAARSVQNLSLINLEITSAAVIARFLFNLTHLNRLTLSQDASPSVAPELSVPGPIYVSDSLEYLHWDVVAYGPSYSDLAHSISSGALPSLHTIRAPGDDDGFLQALCRPTAYMTLPKDGHLLNQIGAVDPFTHPTLPMARRAAQQRLESARSEPYIKIVVDEDGVIQHTYTLKTYMGVLGSRIEYSLLPDVEGSEEAISGLNDLLVRREVEGVEGYCFGNKRGSSDSGRSERERYSAERMSSFGRKRVPAENHQRHVVRKMVKQPTLDLFF